MTSHPLNETLWRSLKPGDVLIARDIGSGRIHSRVKVVHTTSGTVSPHVVSVRDYGRHTGTAIDIALVLQDALDLDFKEAIVQPDKDQPYVVEK